MIDKFMHEFLNRVYGYDDYTQLEINSKLIQKMDEVDRKSTRLNSSH